MISLNQAEEQLKKIGFKKSGLWGGSKIKELSKVLHEDEEIKHCVNGYYEGGFAMLAATNQRLLVIDRKPMFLTIQAIWYDKIGQVDFSRRLMNATICVATPNQTVVFNAWNHHRLHEVLTYSQKRMTELKMEAQPQSQPQQPQAQPIYFLQMPAGHYANYAAGELNSADQNLISSNSAMPTQWPVSSNRQLAARAANARLPYSRRRYYARDT